MNPHKHTHFTHSHAFNLTEILLLHSLASHSFAPVQQMERLLCMAEKAILVNPILRWVVMVLESSLGFNLLHACISCSGFISGVHDGVKSHMQVVTQREDEHEMIKRRSAAKLISKEELEVVLGRMGMFRGGGGGEGEQLEHVSSDELSGLFEEEPSLEEVKEAFCVFDVNADGFIDAAELLRVLSGLGLAEGTELEACRRMITRYDRNQDGKLDFMEFVRVMEISFDDVACN